MFILTDGDMFIGCDNRNKPKVVTDETKAMEFKSSAAAKNYLKCIPECVKGHTWSVIDLDNENEFCEQDICDNEAYQLMSTDNVVTMLENEDFDVFGYFTGLVRVMSQIDTFIDNMSRNQQAAEMKIMDVRHYIRNNDHRLNAVQMQRLGYYLQELEKQRYQYKSNKIIASLIANNLSAMKDTDTIRKMTDVVESEYKPRLLNDVDIEYIINKKKETDVELFKVC